MKLYDLDRNVVENPPQLIYRGLDSIKYKEDDGLVLLKQLLERGNTPSKTLLIKEGLYDFKRGMKGQSMTPKRFKEITRRYLAILENDHLDPKHISDELRYNHLVMFPTPLVSTSTDALAAAHYSRYVERPFLAFGTENLEGVDFRKWKNFDSEVGIFKSIPMENLVQIFYFYEDHHELRHLLDSYGYEDVLIERGYIDSEFRYKSFLGDMIFSVPYNLLSDPNLKSFYKSAEDKLFGHLS